MGSQIVIEYHLVNFLLIAHSRHIQIAYDAAENQSYQKPGSRRYDNDIIDLTGHNAHRNNGKHIPVVIAQRFIGEIAVFIVHRLEFYNTAFLFFQLLRTEIIVKAQLLEIVYGPAGGFTVRIKDDISFLIPDGAEALAVINFHQQLICHILCPACRKQYIADTAILCANRCGKHIEIIPPDFIMQGIGEGGFPLQGFFEIFPVSHIKLHSVRCQTVSLFIGNAVTHKFTVCTGTHQCLKQLFRIGGMLILEHIGYVLQG